MVFIKTGLKSMSTKLQVPLFCSPQGSRYLPLVHSKKIVIESSNMSVKSSLTRMVPVSYKLGIHLHELK